MGTLHQLSLPIIRTVRERVEDNRRDRRARACDDFRKAIEAWLSTERRESLDPDRLALCNLRSTYADAFEAVDGRRMRLSDIRAIQGEVLSRCAADPINKGAFLPAVDVERWRWIAAHPDAPAEFRSRPGSQRDAYVDRPQYTGQCMGPV